MITRLSELFVRTLRDDPADAEVPSHKLLIRAGYVRPVAPGVYSWLPLGLRVLRKIENIVREEMNAIGGQEILLPALLPRAPYETTNRWTEYGDSLFRLKDRRDNDMMLGPTHEELFALTVKGEYSSYKDFPVILYQVQTKYRDEARPRAGILRGREFVMKDSYSFDTSDDGLKAAYHAHRDAYQRIFGRLGLDYVIVAATSGAMGGSASEEFLAESPTGEDTFVRCVESGYAANVEAVITPAPPARPIEGLAEAVVHETGDTPTIATLVDWANSAGLGRTVTAADTLKNILLKVRQPGGDWELLAVGVPGDREVDDKRLGAALEPAEYELLGDADFAKYPFLVRGYIGPKALLANGVRYLVDPRVVEGILRGREFVMKDSYSFDTSDDGLKAAYHAHRDAYQRIFGRLGLDYVIVAATSGAMGGSASEEFLAESPTGEDTFVRCVESGYAANVEAVITPAPPARPIEGLAEAVVHETGDTPTIATLVDWANSAGLGRTVTAADTLKNILLKVRQPGGDWELLAVGVPGDREVDDKRLGAALEPAEYELLGDADFAKYPFLVRGYIGPKALLANGVRYLVDPRVVEGTSWITGADEPGKHVVDLVAGRDFTADGTIEAAEVRDGDPSPDGAGQLVSARGIEIGHIFQLGRKYTDAFTVDVLGENGKPVRLTQGSYGIGVSRLVAVVAEQQHDELGLRWPSAVSPFDVHVVIANKDDAARAGAEELAAELDRLGHEVLLDDRTASPGVKFKDAELLGVPWIVVIGRGWADGTIELRNRFTGETQPIAVTDAVASVTQAIG
ncbi:Prolyl-tRNA synthetase ProS [Mycobacteroides abscessus subsp. abscessus]|nr:Prolyl-tRNA synthetase ProS [Mycobacteroides abscessus subsp. abscessus]